MGVIRHTHFDPQQVAWVRRHRTQLNPFTKGVYAILIDELPATFAGDTDELVSWIQGPPEAPRRGRCGRRLIQTALRELEVAGYVALEERRDPATGRLLGKDWHIWDMPRRFWVGVKNGMHKPPTGARR